MVLRLVAAYEGRKYGLQNACTVEEHGDELLRSMIEAYARERFALAFVAATGAEVPLLVFEEWVEHFVEESDVEPGDV